MAKESNKYSVVIVWSDEDESFVGLCPEFEGLSGIAATRAEAFTETEAVIQDYLAILREDGDPIPEPSTVPGYQGHVSLRWTK